MSAAQTSESKIPFDCPHCGHHTDVDAKFAGHVGPCVSCSNTITVPALKGSPVTGLSKVANSSEVPWVKIGMICGGLLSLGVLGVVIWSAVLRPAFIAARAAASSSTCESNLRAIGQALEDYYAEHGSYPPAVVYDDAGKPMHSWRVLILPYLGPKAQQVYEQYDMEKPWDSIHNNNLIDEIPLVYQCPADSKAVRGETSYLAVVGENTVINLKAPTKRGVDYDGPTLIDNPAETMMVMEASGSGVNWMKPKDIRIDSLRELNGSNPSSPGSEHVNGVHILMADCSIVRLDDTVSSEDLRGMATIDGRNEYIEALDDMQY